MRITLHTDNADAVAERAIAGGARVLMLIQDMFWGARYGKLLDPFGHEWGLNQQIADLSDQETRADNYLASGRKTTSSEDGH